jgi:ABC-2 type transport system permease protein
VLRAVYGIVVRELMRFLRQRGRVLSSIARPFVWLIIAGAGFAGVFAGNQTLDYRRYMAPGLLGMAVLFGALLASLSTVTDRDAGVLRMVLVAPIPRSAIALGKALGATVLGALQAVTVSLVLLPVVHLSPALPRLGLALAAIVLCSLAIGSLGLVLAATIRSIENFAGIMNFVAFPMLFLCGALYPVRNLSMPLRWLAYLNPLAHGVDLLKHALLAPWAALGYGGEWPVALDFTVLVLWAIVGLAAATPLLAREGGLSRVAFREGRG